MIWVLSTIIKKDKVIERSQIVTDPKSQTCDTFWVFWSIKCIQYNGCVSINVQLHVFHQLNWMKANEKIGDIAKCNFLKISLFSFEIYIDARKKKQQKSRYQNVITAINNAMVNLLFSVIVLDGKQQPCPSKNYGPIEWLFHRTNTQLWLVHSTYALYVIIGNRMSVSVNVFCFFHFCNSDLYACNVYFNYKHCLFCTN